MYSGKVVIKLPEGVEEGFEKANNSSLNRLGGDAGFDIN
jgi:hypothetical protein